MPNISEKVCWFVNESAHFSSFSRSFSGCTCSTSLLHAVFLCVNGIHFDILVPCGLQLGSRCFTSVAKLILTYCGSDGFPCSYSVSISKYSSSLWFTYPAISSVISSALPSRK